MSTVRNLHVPHIHYSRDGGAATHAYPDDQRLTFEPISPDDYQAQVIVGPGTYVPTYYILGF